MIGTLQPNGVSHSSSSDTEIAALKSKMAKINKNLLRVLQVNQQVKAVTPNCETCGGPHSFNDCLATVGNTQNVYATGSYQVILTNLKATVFCSAGANQNQNPPLSYQALANQAPVYQAPVHQPQIPQPQVVTTNEFTNFMKANDAILKNIQTNMTSLTNSNLELKNMFDQFMKMNTASSSGSGTLPGNTITNPKEDTKVITTRSGTAYQGPMIPNTSSSLPPVVERETEATKDTVHPTSNRSTKDVQPLVVQTESPIQNSEPIIAPIIEPVASLVSAPKPNQRPLIPYPSRLHDQKLRDKDNEQRENFFQIFKDLNFNISFADALILMPKFGPTIKTLLTNKYKLSKLARTPLNEHCSAVLLKKLPKKLGDPGKFLISCDFFGMAECLALADLDASINLMPLSVWNKLSLLDLSPTCMTLELADHSISRRSFLKTKRALIDVFEACEEYSQEVLGFSDVIASGNPTPYYHSILSTTSSTLTPFENSDFLLEEVDAFLALEDDPTSPKVDQSYVDIEGDILLLEAFLNDDPSLSPPNQGNYLPQVRKELKIYEAKSDKSSIDEPPEVEPKDLPPHLEYAFLEEKTTFTHPYGTFAYRHMPSGLCNAPGTFQRCMMAIFHDMIEKTIEVFMDDFSAFRNSFQTCLSHLDRMLKRCEDTNLCLNWEKSHFMVKEGIVLGHKISKEGIEVDKAKVNVIAKLPHPTTVKDSKARLLRWVLLLQEFTFKVIDTKGAENLAANHLSQLENLHQNVLDPKEINESFPLETLNLVSTYGNSSTPCIISVTTPLCSKSVRIKSSEGVYTAREPLTFLRLATIDPPGTSWPKLHSQEVWGIEFIGLFPSSRGNKYILVAVDYLSKWVEVKALPTNDARVVCIFLKNLFARFRTPEPLSVIEERTSAMTILQSHAEVWCHSSFSYPVSPPNKWSGGGVKLWFKMILKRTVGENHASRSDNLDDALWAIRSAYKTPIGCTPYKLVYGKACHLPIELEHKAYWPLKHANFDLQTAGDHKKVQLNELNKLHYQAYENSLIYKEKTKRLHD
nr:reverse transcriptase domain-containing protein [Tanacetum cinerariifolium]